MLPGYLGSLVMSISRGGVSAGSGTLLYRQCDCDGGITAENTTPTGQGGYASDTKVMRQGTVEVSGDFPLETFEGDPPKMEEGDIVSLVATGGRTFTGSILVEHFKMTGPSQGVASYTFSGKTQGAYHWGGY